MSDYIRTRRYIKVPAHLPVDEFTFDNMTDTPVSSLTELNLHSITVLEDLGGVTVVSAVVLVNKYARFFSLFRQECTFAAIGSRSGHPGTPGQG